MTYLQVLCVLLICLSVSDTLNYRRYHSSEEIQQFLLNISQKYPNITHLYKIGASTRGKNLTVVAIGNRASEYVALRPNVNFIANMHGNELVGSELMLRLIENLTISYTMGDLFTQELLNTTLLHILVSLNPDGAEVALRDSSNRTYSELCSYIHGRANANKIDLNRNYPDMFEGNTPVIQDETKAIMKWIEMYSFVITLSFHGGALVANYPLDNYKGDSSSNWKEARYSKSSQDEILKNLASVYSNNHPIMKNGYSCSDDSIDTSRIVFPGGITNGAGWYPITGGLQDYIYSTTGSLSLTVEVGCCKQPPPGKLPSYWRNNYSPMMEVIKLANYGVRGYVVDEFGKVITNISIIGEDYVQPISKHGEYFQLLKPGSILIKPIKLNISNTTISILLMDRPIDRLFYKNITLYSCASYNLQCTLLIAILSYISLNII